MRAFALRPLPLLVKIVLLAALYLLAGRLALLLAIAPGFATAIFPPIGIGLAAVLIWGYPLLLGVLLGATLLNLSIAAPSLTQISLQGLPVALSIAVGSSLQCLLAPQLQQALAHNQGYADSFAVHLRLDLSDLPATTTVHIDSLRLQQVLSNLISNAVKFSEAQGQVSIRASLSGQQVRVEVSDQGPGISEEFRPRIFQKFAQADSSSTRLRGGTGLGLSICKTLLERMHGEIGFTSVPGQGSTFYFSLPLAND